MAKYNRHQSISKNSDDNYQEDHWLKQFEKNLLKDAVQPRNNSSLFDQINSIMNGSSKSKYPSVEAAVQDMQERSGLTAYLKAVKSLEESKVATQNQKDKRSIASEEIQADAKNAESLPTVIKKCPAIMQTLENYIRDSKGNLPVPAIIDKIHAIHKNDVSNDKDWNEDKLIMLVSKMNLAAKTNNPNNYQHFGNLGNKDIGTVDIDPSNTDAFFALNPAKQ